MPDDVHAHPLAEDLQLLGGGGAEGVPGSQDYLAPGLGEMMRQLSDAGGLANAVDAHHQNYVWPG